MQPRIMAQEETKAELVMWPGTNMTQYERDVQIAGWRSDSEHLRWFAANPNLVLMVTPGRWRYEGMDGQFYETDDLVGAIVIAKETARKREQTMATDNITVHATGHDAHRCDKLLCDCVVDEFLGKLHAGRAAKWRLEDEVCRQQGRILELSEALADSWKAAEAALSVAASSADETVRETARGALDTLATIRTKTCSVG